MRVLGVRNHVRFLLKYKAVSHEVRTDTVALEICSLT